LVFLTSGLVFAGSDSAGGGGSQKMKSHRFSKDPIRKISLKKSITLLREKLNENLLKECDVIEPFYLPIYKDCKYPKSFTTAVLDDLNRLEAMNDFFFLKKHFSVGFQGIYSHTPSSHSAFTKKLPGSAIYFGKSVRKTMLKKYQFAKLILHEILHHVLLGKLGSDEALIEDVAEDIILNKGLRSSGLKTKISEQFFYQRNHTKDYQDQALKFVKVEKNFFESLSSLLGREVAFENFSWSDLKFILDERLGHSLKILAPSGVPIGGFRFSSKGIITSAYLCDSGIFCHITEIESTKWNISLLKTNLIETASIYSTAYSFQSDNIFYRSAQTSSDAHYSIVMKYLFGEVPSTLALSYPGINALIDQTNEVVHKSDGIIFYRRSLGEIQFSVSVDLMGEVTSISFTSNIGFSSNLMGLWSQLYLFDSSLEVGSPTMNYMMRCILKGENRKSCQVIY
jgi:hypothetical protein